MGSKDDDSNREVNILAESYSKVRKGLLTAIQSCSCEAVSVSCLIIQTSVGPCIILAHVFMQL